MSTLVNHEHAEKIIIEVLQKDMNQCLDKIVDEAVDKLKDTVRANVAARMIALARSDYSMEYLRNELIIKVRLETK